MPKVHTDFHVSLYSVMYPIIADPPLFSLGFHERTAESLLISVTASGPTGGEGGS